MTVRVIRKQLINNSGVNWSTHQHSYYLAANWWQLFKNRWWDYPKPTVVEIPAPAGFRAHVASNQIPEDLLQAVSASQFPCTIHMQLETGMDPWLGNVLEPTERVEVTFADPRDAMMFKLAHA